VDDNLFDDLLLSDAAARQKNESEDDTNRFGEVDRPANKKRRRSYLKMARNDENLSTGLMKAQLYGTVLLIENTSARDCCERWLP
jgi:hypothetical protein